MESPAQPARPEPAAGAVAGPAEPDPQRGTGRRRRPCRPSGPTARPARPSTDVWHRRRRTGATGARHRRPTAAARQPFWRELPALWSRDPARAARQDVRRPALLHPVRTRWSRPCTAARAARATGSWSTSSIYDFRDPRAGRHRRVPRPARWDAGDHLRTSPATRSCEGARGFGAARRLRPAGRRGTSSSGSSPPAGRPCRACDGSSRSATTGRTGRSASWTSPTSSARQRCDEHMTVRPGHRPQRAALGHGRPPQRLGGLAVPLRPGRHRRRHLRPDESTVPVDDVIGKAFVIAWPPSRWRTLGTPPTSSSAAGALPTRCGPARRRPGRWSCSAPVAGASVRRSRRHEYASLRPAALQFRPPRPLVRRDAGRWAATSRRCAGPGSSGSPVPTRPAAAPAPARWWSRPASCRTAGAGSIAGAGRLQAAHRGHPRGRSTTGGPPAGAGLLGRGHPGRRVDAHGLHVANLGRHAPGAGAR